mgnify:CR=1 FL=1
MSRKNTFTRRITEPDPVYSSPVITRFINRVMESGKKTIAQKIVYSALEEIAVKTKKDGMEVFEAAINNVAPRVEVRPRRVGGANYQVPVEVRGDRKEALAIRWIIKAAHDRPSREYHTMKDKLVAELIDASNNVGAAIKKREDTIRMADANKAFAHFRW